MRFFKDGKILNLLIIKLQWAVQMGQQVQYIGYLEDSVFSTPKMSHRLPLK